MVNGQKLPTVEGSTPPDDKSAAPQGSGLGEALPSVELSSELRADLLDLAAWTPVLATYARTMKVAVALTDCNGKVLGPCHNPQPVWQLVQGTAKAWGGECFFCLTLHSSCSAITDALRTGGVVLARDRAGLMHLAVPLTLAGQCLGAIIAGQVFNRYPEPLPLERVASEFDVSAQELWHLATKQRPVSRTTLQVYGELLYTLGQAFLRQRYGEILQRKLAESNQRFRLLVDGVKDYALFTVDGSGGVTSWNSGAERMLAYTEAEIVGQNFSRLFTPDDIRSGVPAAQLEQAAREGSAADERWQVRKDGTPFLATSTLASIGKGAGREFGKILCDVTERRKQEEALHQEEKLESIGHLAGGIAHDFNNLLAPILGNASLLLDHLPALDPDRPPLEDIVVSSERAAELINRLLLYAGKGRYIITSCDISALISNILPQIESALPKTVQLGLDLAPALPMIQVDASLIQETVMALVINAVEAIEAQPGTLRISTGATDLAAGEGVTSGRYVYMEIQDSGMGMDNATRGRVFEPFFTTKFMGRGLGLATAFGAVRAHQGRMQVESVPGAGSTFKVFFPAVEPHLERLKENPSSIGKPAHAHPPG